MAVVPDPHFKFLDRLCGFIQRVQVSEKIVLGGPDCFAVRNRSELIRRHCVLLLSERERGARYFRVADVSQAPTLITRDVGDGATLREAVGKSGIKLRALVHAECTIFTYVHCHL